MDVIKNWFKRHFSDRQVVILAGFLVLGFAVVVVFGKMLAPVIASLIVAYLLEGMVARLEGWGVPRIAGVLLVFLGFLAALLVLVLGIIPILSTQFSQLVQQLPTYFNEIRSLLHELPEKYPQFVSQEQVDRMIGGIGDALTSWGETLVKRSLSSVFVVITLLVFLILVPILVFFFLKDKEKMLAWVSGYLPRDRHLVMQVWHEVDAQIGNYVRGKVLEIAIVGAVTSVTFVVMDLEYAILLGTLTGLSVIVPYIGAAVVTIPVGIVAFFQFGWGADFIYVLVAYLLIQALDGNALVPLLFSEVVNLHPVAIIVAVLVFGGLWGFWGVFFAIPLATLVQAVLRAWPSRPPPEAAAPEEATEVQA